MSLLSYAAGSRFLQLFGGVNLSFYDWYCDLPPASPEIWGEQTDVAESADWYNSKFIAVMGSNLQHDPHAGLPFRWPRRATTARRWWCFAPDFSQVSKYADQWIPVNAGQDGAFWMAVNHVILKEFHHEQADALFPRTTSSATPIRRFLVQLEKQGRNGYRGRSLAARQRTRALRGRRERRLEVPGLRFTVERRRACRAARWAIVGEKQKGNGTLSQRTRLTDRRSLRS